MSERWTTWGWSALVLFASAGAAWEIFAGRTQPTAKTETPSAAVETLLPADTVFYARHDGAKAHSAAWQQTAAHEALSAARVDELIQKLVAFLRQQAPGTFDPRAEALATHLNQYGGSLSVSVPPNAPLPRATLVLHHAAQHIEFVSEVSTILAENNIPVEIRENETRKVRVAHLLKVPAIDLAWWAEGGHLIIAAGVDPVRKTLAVANGTAPNITKHRLWSAETSNPNQTITSRAWIDVQSLRKSFGGFPIPIPEGKPITIGDALKILGFDNVDELVANTGYEGKALWSETQLNMTGPRTGLLSMVDGDEISFDDLPPLPVNTKSFLAASLKPAAAYETLRRVIREGLAYGPEEAAQEVERAIDTIPNFLGFDPKTDFLDALGSIVVVCDDPDQGFLGTGSTLIVQVKDAEKIRQTIENIVAKIDSLAPDEEILKIHRAKKHGREIWTLEAGQVVQGLGIAVEEDWLVVALMPQPVEAFFLRADGKLPAWSKDQLTKQGVPVVPEKFTSLGVSNPRLIYQSLLKLAPYGMSALVAGLKEDGTLPRKANLPWMLSDLPPAELVAGPLFPNVRTMTLDETGIRWTSRSSLPSLPVVGGPGGGNGALAGSVVTGLLLPAIQQSRAAARRAQSRNNLKQLGLAMHNYHDAHKSFPAGTVPNEKLKPDERLSFLVELLPYLDQAELYKKIDKEGGWAEKGHREIMETQVPALINPAVVPAAVPREDNAKPADANYARTHYVGLAGIGKDAALLPITDKRAGVFGYHRKTRLSDITDGTSNTLMISEASKDYGPWGAGGKATLRSLTKKPYINGPDGIGGPLPGGCQMLMGDGSVRFISQVIDPDTLEALITIRGGEAIDSF